MVAAKIAALFPLFRFELPLSAGVCVILGEVLAVGGLPSGTQAAYGFLSFFFISATALILNDYFDIETDRVNAPSRPLPSGRVTEREAVILATAVAAAGLGFAFLVSVTVFAGTLVVWLVGFLYNWRLKRTGLWGNLAVAFSVGVTFIVGGVIVDRPFEPVVWYLAVTAFFVDLGEEIAADALDVEGDRLVGSRSLAVRWGSQRAMQIAAGVFCGVIVGTSIPFLVGWLRWIYLAPILVWDFTMAFALRHLLDHGRSNRIDDIRRIYLGGLGTMVIFIVIRLSLG